MLQQLIPAQLPMRLRLLLDRCCALPVRWYVSGLIPEGKQVPIATADPASLISEIQVVGSLDGNRQDAIETLNLAAKEVTTT